MFGHGDLRVDRNSEDNLAAVAALSEKGSLRVYLIVVAFALVFGSSLFLDRLPLSVFAPAFRQVLNIGPLASGGVLATIVWGYALLHVPAGWPGDLWRARKVLSAIIVLRSALTAPMAVVWNLPSLLAIGFLFGAAEPGALLWLKINPKEQLA